MVVQQGNKALTGCPWTFMKTSLWFRFPIPRLSGQDPEGLFPSVVAKHLSKKMGSNLFCRGLREQKQLVFFLKSNHPKVLKSDTQAICFSFCFFPRQNFMMLSWVDQTNGSRPLGLEVGIAPGFFMFFLLSSGFGLGSRQPPNQQTQQRAFLFPPQHQGAYPWDDRAKLPQTEAGSLYDRIDRIV